MELFLICGTYVNEKGQTIHFADIRMPNIRERKERLLLEIEAKLKAEGCKPALEVVPLAQAIATR